VPREEREQLTVAVGDPDPHFFMEPPEGHISPPASRFL
jgi:hypothetical protein